MNGKETLFAQLEQSPEDWGVRIALIEWAVREGDLAGAKRLVRASPAGVPTPPQIQIRLHALLTQGVAALEPAKDEVTVPPANAVVPVPPEPRSEALASAEKTRPRNSARNPATPVPVPVAAVDPANSAPCPAEASLDGGLGALVEADPRVPQNRRSAERIGSRLVSVKRRKGPPGIDRAAISEKWDRYDGGLELVELELPEVVERPTHAPEKVSSVSFALLAHVAILVVLSLVAVQVRRPDPPQLVVSTQHEREAELVTTRITRPTPEVRPSAAAAQALDVISSLASSSTFSVPEVENATEQFVSSTMPGIAPVGTGVSFSTETVRSSDVNFFGLSGSGRRIVFIVDATPEMLVDEKGGMSAYNKVKEEIGTMLANLNRATHFNLLLYQGKELAAFRDEPVPGLPSNLRQAIEWLDPLNRDYDALGLRGGFGPSQAVSGRDDLPIAAVDVAHYTKAVQKALEWQASAIFCITVGYRGMNRVPTPEMLKKMAEMPRGNPGTVDPREQEAWQRAIERTREWLARENAARRENGLDPKVVVNFNQLVREITGASPPQRRGGDPGGAAMPSMPPVTPEDIERQVQILVKELYKAEGLDEPSLHMVLFLGEEEDLANTDEDHFKSLTRRNRGKLKILRGLAALRNVTGAGGSE